jgi:hypothetical protein
MMTISFVDLAPYVPLVAARVGLTEEQVRAYLGGDDQDDAILDGFAFFQVFPFGKFWSDMRPAPAEA